MHRKNTRRWHKLLSVSGIIVALFGMIYLPAANAQPGGPRPMAIYGPSYSKDSTQVQYIDFSSNVYGLEPSDLFIAGTAQGCVLQDFPTLNGFSFGVMLTGCGEGILRLGLKAESVAFANGTTGPTMNYVGFETEINFQPLVISYENVPAEFTTSSVEFQIALNHLLYPSAPYSVSVIGDGCTLNSVNELVSSLSILVDNCSDGTSVGVSIDSIGIRDVFGNNGTQTAFASPLVPVRFPVATPTPSPTPTPDPTPTADPTASPTATPTPTPTPSDVQASVTVTSPPTEPPPPPTAPEPVVQQEPVLQTPTEVSPIVETPVEAAPIEVLVSEPIAVVRNRIVEARKAIVEPVTEPLPIEDPAPIVPIVEPVVEPVADSNFNWQPIGYLALAVGGATGTIGGGLLLQRMLRVRRLKFS